MLTHFFGCLFIGHFYFGLLSPEYYIFPWIFFRKSILIFFLQYTHVLKNFFILEQLMYLLPILFENMPKNSFSKIEKYSQKPFILNSQRSMK